MPEPKTGETGTAQSGQQVDSSGENNQNQPAGGSETFTREELNAHTDKVVKERIDKQNEKHSKALASLQKELDAATKEVEDLKQQVSGYELAKEHSNLVSKVAKETGLTAAQVELLKGDTEEDLTAAANSFKASMPSRYPDVNSASGKTPPISKEDVLKIRNPEERIAAMGKHPDLFR